MIKKTLLISALLLGAAGAVQARDTEMLIPARVSFASADAKPLTERDVRNAILTAGAKRGWMPRGDAADRITLAYNKQGKHEAVIDVLFDASSFQLAYVSSHNLNYERKASGVEHIHPNFNKWLMLLANDINVELLKLR
jgi:hypothetical protein